MPAPPLARRLQHLPLAEFPTARRHHAPGLPAAGQLATDQLAANQQAASRQLGAVRPAPDTQAAADHSLAGEQAA